MRFAVPQFIDVEDKVFGPLTVRQFIYLAGGGGLGFIAFKMFSAWIGIPLGALLAGAGATLAFIKFNDKPLINLLEAMFNYITRDRLYIYKQEKVLRKSAEEQTRIQTEETKPAPPKNTTSKLHDISWGLDVLDKEKEK